MTTGPAWNYVLRAATRVSTVSAGAVGITSANNDSFLSYMSPSTTQCENKATVQRRISSVGNLSLLSESREHPANQTLLIALVGKPFHKSDFEKLWRKHDMFSRHPRFHQKVKMTNTHEKDSKAGRERSAGVFVPSQLPVESHVKETPFPTIYNLNLQDSIQSFLQAPLKVQNHLWQVEIATGGQLGQSGAIPKNRAAELTIDASTRKISEPKESLLIVRGHDALADSVALAAAFTELCDEAADLRKELAKEHEENIRQRKARSWWQRFVSYFHALYYYSIGSIQAFWYYWRLFMTTSPNPFQQMENLEDTKTNGERSLSWFHVATVAEVEHVAKSLTKNKEVSMNDVIMSCVTAAVARQIQEHQMQNEIDQDKRRGIKIPKKINVMVPVQSGGDAANTLLRNGQTVGHRMGAFFASVPTNMTSIASERLAQVHDSLCRVQQGPTLFWSRLGTQVISSVLPASWATSLLQWAQPNASFLVTFSRGPSRRIHFDGREVEILQSFTPLPAGVPIGVVVSTYAGNVSISVTAEPWAVPDAEKFLNWVLEEYKFLYTESPAVLEG